jgi:hypothetical protein
MQTLTIGEIEPRWHLVRSLWDELDIEHLLAQQWLSARRWQLDLFGHPIRAMDEMYEEPAWAKLMNERERDQ